MPVASIKHVISFTSETKPHLAENLLNGDKRKAWHGEAGKSQHAVVLQLEKACIITGIDVGNAGSAFVEVLVARLESNQSDFKTFLPVTKLMSPSESKDWINTQAVHMFGIEKFDRSVQCERWDRLRIIVRQPYNKLEAFGLTFVNVHTSDVSSSKAISSRSSTVPKESGPIQPESNSIGLFKLRDMPASHLSSGGLFFKRSSLNAGHTPESGLSLQQKSSTNDKYATVSSRLSAQREVSFGLPSTVDKPVVDHKLSKVSSAPTSSSTLGLTSSSSSTYSDRKKVLQTSKTLPSQVASLPMGITDTKPSEKQSLSDYKTMKSPSMSVAEKRFMEQSNAQDDFPSKKPRLKRGSTVSKYKAKRSKPYSEVPHAEVEGVESNHGSILDGVVFALSGFKNPFRTELREKGVALGATYKPDWTSKCTHLISAFEITPKTRAADRDGGYVVKKEWIIDAYDRKIHPREKSYEFSSRPRPTYIDDEDEDEMENEESYGDDDDDEWYSDDFDPAKAMEHSNDDEYIPPTKKTLSKVMRKTSDPTRRDKSKQNSTRKRTSSEGQTDDTEDTDDEIAAVLSTHLRKGAVAGDLHADRSSKKMHEEIHSRGSLVSPSGSVTLPSSPSPADEKLSTDNGLPYLPDFLSGVHIFFYQIDDVRVNAVAIDHPKLLKQLSRIVIAYAGRVDMYMTETTTHVVTAKPWDDSFDDALSDNDGLFFVVPDWLMTCHEKQAKVDTHPFRVKRS
eukprot:gene9594-1819_t